ncbi:MAG TPA: selenium-dependent molybdenum cofactor biosynthesis protein YqeB [Candidatus Binatia bacterium]|nr:selenium-dependent molybdenum cofactor biosynthesis protein YqeB [Candidatus Binatia bacterium]
MTVSISELIVLIRGGGEMATGIAHRLHRCHMRVLITEIIMPTSVRRNVAFAEAVYKGAHTVEGVEAVRAASCDEAYMAWKRNQIPVFVDPEASIREILKPVVIVDAIMAKKNGVARLTDAPVVIGVGPGFTAGFNVHAVVESNRGHHLGRVIWDGAAETDTGIPASVDGYTASRVLRAPRSGTFNALRAIGDVIATGEPVAHVNGELIKAEISGQIRGLLRNGIQVQQGSKAGDIDPRGERGYCDSISDKSRAIAGGVLEAVLHSLGDLKIHGDSKF